MAVVTNSTGFVDAIRYFIDHLLKLSDLTVDFISYKEFQQEKDKEVDYDYVIYHFVDEFESPNLNNSRDLKSVMNITGTKGTVFVDYKLEREQLEQVHADWAGNLTILKISRDPRTFAESTWSSDLARTALGALFCTIESNYHVVFAKYPVLEDYSIDEFTTAVKFKVKHDDCIYSHYRHVCIDFNGSKNNAGLMAVGDRGKKIESFNDQSNFVAYELTQEQYQDTCDSMYKILPHVVNDSAFE